jgi:hypothetical protein
VVAEWTGKTATALRAALRLTIDQFAQQLGTASRTVAKWSSDPKLVPVTELQRALDTTLRQAPVEAQERFAHLALRHEPHAPTHPVAFDGDHGPSAAELRVSHDPEIRQCLDWIDTHAGWKPGEASRQLMAAGPHPDRPRTVTGRAEVARALAEYYRPAGDYLRYTARVDDERIETSVLTRPEWTDLRLPLGRGVDRMILTTAQRPATQLRLANAAVKRVAAVIASGTRMVNNPLYDLQQITVTDHGLEATVGITDFLTYALTLDLLEYELHDAIAAGQPTIAGSLPLRDHYLLDVDAVTDLPHRVCAGGPVALFAAARPGSRARPGQSDYVLLVQERSARTVNANRRLAVIPKAFHQPLVDFSDDAHIGATIERELEEEVFGRADLDDSTAPRRQADPLHLTRLSPPMRWLVDHDDAWRMECTGFGFNLVSGNFEVASLIVVDDEAWWAEFSGSVEANWEAEGLRRFSTLDRVGIAALVHDASWTNEALFALLQGLRRLTEIGGRRVDLPEITMER